MSISQLDDPSMREALGVDGGGVAPPSTTLPFLEIEQGGYIGIGGATLPAPVPLANVLKLYKDPARTLWSGLLTSPIPSSGGADVACLVNESKDFDALAVGNLKVFNQGANFDINADYLHLGELGALNHAIGITSADGTVTTPFLDTNTPTSFNLSNVATLTGYSGGAALTNIATINGSPVGGGALRNTASSLDAPFVQFGDFGVFAPAVLAQQVIQNFIPVGGHFLLTATLYCNLIPKTPFVGGDKVFITCEYETPSMGFADVFAPLNSITYDTPDGTQSTQIARCFTNQVELTSDGQNITVTFTVVSSDGNHDYFTNGQTVLFLSITELANPI